MKKNFWRDIEPARLLYKQSGLLSYIINCTSVYPRKTPFLYKSREGSWSDMIIFLKRIYPFQRVFSFSVSVLFLAIFHVSYVFTHFCVSEEYILSIQKKIVHRTFRTSASSNFWNWVFEFGFSNVDFCMLDFWIKILRLGFWIRILDLFFNLLFWIWYF